MAEPKQRHDISKSIAAEQMHRLICRVLRSSTYLFLSLLVVLVWSSLWASGQTIVVDGMADDWVGQSPIADDPIGDSEAGYLDITVVYSLQDPGGLYFLVEFADASQDVEQFDLEVSDGSRSFLISVQKPSSSGFVGEVTSDYVPLGETSYSSFAFSLAWEGFVDLRDLPISGNIALTQIDIMAGECCEYPAWHAADSASPSEDPFEPNFHPVQPCGDPEAYAGQGFPWAEVSIQLLSMPGYKLEHVWAGHFALPWQIDRLPDGSLVVGDTERSRMVRVSEEEIDKLTSGVNTDNIVVLPDGRIAHYSDSGDIWALDPSSGGSELLHDIGFWWDGDLRGPLAVDAIGRLYTVDDERRLLRFNLNGTREVLTGVLPYDELWHITDLDVGLDGTVYVAGFTKVLAVSPAGAMTIVDDGLVYEPVWIDVATDGKLYINEMAKGLQRYDPVEETLTSLDAGNPFGDVSVRTEEDAAFYGGDAVLYRFNLLTDELSPIARADTLNSAAFAATGTDNLYCATAGMGPWGSHIVKLNKDGTYEEYPDLTFSGIYAADVDAQGRLCLVSGQDLLRLEHDRSVTIIPLALPAEVCSMHRSDLACRPLGGWVIAALGSDSIRFVEIQEDGTGSLLPIQFDQNSFSRHAYDMSAARIDAGEDGQLHYIVAARETPDQGAYFQRVYQANADGTGQSEVANLDCGRTGGINDIAVGPGGRVYVLAVTGETGDDDAIFRVEAGENPIETVWIAAGQDPRSIDVGADGTVWFGTTLGVFCASPTPKAFSVDSGGNLEITGLLHAAGFESGAADIAEWVSVSEPVEPGDVVELDPNHPSYYRKARKPYSALIGGVISTEPAFKLGAPDAQWEDQLNGGSLLVLVGIVPVKATTENGPIHPGDLLVSSSTPGHAMRCTDLEESEGAIIGKALEPLEEGNGLIQMLIMH